ncbi:type II secretion system major pseudopilin GspG [Hyphomonas sp.]|jgi:general secretion pathway protein G|uniref:type II secretion system major pseudopilin GspG n=1 Tax=Hyphomonas sp. TaxID=87 RepID=UPI0039E26151
MTDRTKEPARVYGPEAGFSLMELLVAMVILALIMGVVAPRVVGYLSRAKSQTAEVQIRNIKAAADMFLLDVGRYPTDEEGLRALVEPRTTVTGWFGPYLQEKTIPVDPWGQPFRYSVSDDGMEVHIFSLGRDNAEGGSGEDEDVAA